MPDSESLLRFAREMLANMVALDKNVAIYPARHPSVIEPAARICEISESLFADRRRISFNIVNSEIYVEKQQLREESLKYSDFVKLLMQRGVNSLSLEPGVTPESLAIFFSLINGKKEADLSEESLKARMKEKGVTGINFEKLVALDLAEDVYEVMEEEEGSLVARSSYEGALECMESVEHDVLANRPLNANALQVVVSRLLGDFMNDRDAVMGIVSIKNYDEYLFHHSVNVAITSLLIASKLSLDEKVTKVVGIGGLLHDIGKLKVPRELLNKPGRLTENEWIVMRRHPIEGAQILMRNETFGELPVLAALEHHAGYDLTGYPTIKGKLHPHALARIVGIADFYEAMTSNRSYRPAQSVNQAVSALIDGTGTQFDPLLVKLLLNTIGVFPPGSIVRLRNGEAAVVVEPNEDNSFLPKVRIIRGSAALSPEGPIIDTSEDPSNYAVIGVADSQEI
jgi:putative nucleotidyltransferase with HDIG domain